MSRLCSPLSTIWVTVIVLCSHIVGLTVPFHEVFFHRIQMARANNLTLYNSAYPVYKSIHLFENHDPFYFLKDKNKKKKLLPYKKKVNSLLL